jgi:hypothetical protein
MNHDNLDQRGARLISACDLWLAGQEIKFPTDFYEQIKAIRDDAARAIDATAVQVVKDRLLKLTGKLIARDWIAFERRQKEQDTAEFRPKFKNLRSSALRSF